MRRFRLTPATIFLIALAAGVANALLLLGRGPIDPSNTAWIFGDNGTYYSAWEQYRHDRHLNFPLTWTDRVGWPIGTSIAFMDALPIVAVVLRPFSPLLSEPFQYLGLWITLCFVLQTYFGISLCRRLFPDDPLFCVLGGLSFLLAPALTVRTGGHTTLMSQWLILAGLDAYFREPAGRVRWMSRFWIVAAVAAATTPYVAAMCALIAVAGVARLRIEKRAGWISSAALLGATMAIVAASGITFGVLASDDAKAYWAPGYGQFSWNLNSFVNPMGHGSILLPPLPLAYVQQYEGYSYLGLGIIALLVVNLVRRPQAIARLRERSAIPLIALALVCMAIAVSAVVTLGARTLFVVSLPKFATHALGGLRASGRLVWPAYYLIAIGALALTCAIWKPRARATLLAFALVLQFADTMPQRKEARTAMDLRFPNPTVSPLWRDLGRTYDNLVLVPTLQCAASEAPGGQYSFVYFGKLAARERMTINSYYAARYTRQELQGHCVDLLRRQLTGDLDRYSAYVVTDAVRTIWTLNGVTSHVCRVADGYNLCGARGAGGGVRGAEGGGREVGGQRSEIGGRRSEVGGQRSEVGGRRSGAEVAEGAEDTWKMPAAAPYALNTPIDFTHANGNARAYETFGWTDPTGGGTWTEGPLAMLRLAVDAAARTQPLVLDVDAMPFLAAAHPRLDVDVFVNGRQVSAWSYRLDSPASAQQATIPAETARARNELDIEFRVRNPEAPIYAGTGVDSRFLGFAVRTLVVRDEEAKVTRNVTDSVVK